MSNHILGKIEQQRKQPFSAGEIQRLLTPNAAGKYEQLEAFYEQQEVSQWLPQEEFKKMLKVRLNAIRELLYFKELEGRLSTKVEKKIEQTAGDFHNQIADLLHHETVLDENILETIRGTRNQDILSGEIVIEPDKVSAYVELVREELRRQVFQIQNIDMEAAATDRELLRSLYEKSSYMVDFIVSHGDLSSSSSNYLKAFLTEKLRSKEALKFVKELYEELQKYLLDQETDEGKKSIQNLVKRLQNQMERDKQGHIKRVLEEHAGDLQMTQAELQDMLIYGVRGTGDVTYEQRMGLHLEEIESAMLAIELEKMTSHPKQQEINLQLGIIKAEVKIMKEEMEAFKEEKYTVEYEIELLPETVADRLAKSQLEKACYFLKRNDGQSEANLKNAVKAFDTPEKVGEFIKNAEQKAVDFLCEKAKPPFKRETIETLKKNDINFDLYLLVDDQNRYENRPQPKEGKVSEYEENQQNLKKLEELIIVMESSVKSQFRDVDSVKKFETAHREFEKIQKDNRIKVQVPEYLRELEVTPEKVANSGMVEEEIPLQLPSSLWNRYEAALLARENLNRFKRSRESILQLSNFEDESQLRTGLGAFFADYFEVNESNGMEVNKLTKVMSLDHPLTCIRFNASDKKPFDSRRGTYDFHKIDGRPATYKQRSVALMKSVQQCLQTGDFSQMMKLFNRGEKADRLYMDSVFFPISAIKNTEEREGILYDTVKSKTSDEVARTLSSKIPAVYRSHFKVFEDQDSKEYQEMIEKFDRDQELQRLGSSLDEDESFTNAFEEMERYMEMAQMYMDSLVFQEDGSVMTNPESIPFSTGEVAGLGMVSKEDLRLNRKQIEELMKHSPLIAARAAQLNSVGRGYLAGGAQLAAREAMDFARLPIQYARSFGQLYWKSLRFYSLTSIFIAFHEFYEHVANLADFGRKFKAYTLLKDTFAGTIIGSEFGKLQQSKENERVDAFKGAFAQYGNEDIRKNLLNPRDRFELKATMIEGFDNRGLFTIEDILRNEVFDVINKYTPSKIIPKKYTDEEMLKDPNKKAEMTNHVREALDNIWGQGTWSGWRTNGASKYESNRKAANDNFSNNTGGEKLKVFTQWWDWLKEPEEDNPLKKIAPAELVGSIENDMQRCNNDSGEIFAIMQALICKGYIRLEHVARLQDVHVNDLPIFTLLEPEQARLSGMTDYVDEELKKGAKYDVNTNSIVQFYQGKKALKLKAIRDVGKWKIPKTEEALNKAIEEKVLEEVYLTAHELQKNREPQPNFIKKMDNGVTGIYGPAYSIEKIINALNRNAQGDIDDARDHDIVALYRGMHEKMAAYMKVLGDMSVDLDATEFKRNIYNAYNEIGKTSAFATYLAGHAQRQDHDINLGDGSPNYDSVPASKHGMPEGLSAFEKLIIPNTGRAQRLNESNGTLDDMPDEDGFREFRKNFKVMSGYQFTLGVDDNGKKSGHPQPYDRKGYKPSTHFQDVIESFKNHVLELAKKREKKFGKSNFHEEIRQSLERSSIANFKLNNEARQKKISDWKVDEAKLDT